MSNPKAVIIAEPDPLISGVLRVEFSRRNFSVYMAASGPEAEEYATRIVVDLIVLDARLHLDAYDACARIRRRPEYTELPILLTTNKPSPRVLAAASAAGATSILVKPYSVGDMFHAVQSYVPRGAPSATDRHPVPGLDHAGNRNGQPEQRGHPDNHAPSLQARPLVPVIGGKGVLIPLVRKLQP